MPDPVTPGVQALAQPLQIGLGGAIHPQRMDAQRIGRIMRVRQRAHRVEVVHCHRRQHQPRHAGGARALDHRGAVGVELRRVEMAMGIDPVQHPRIMRCGRRRRCKGLRNVIT